LDLEDPQNNTTQPLSDSSIDYFTCFHPKEGFFSGFDKDPKTTLVETIHFFSNTSQSTRRDKEKFNLI
jgi:hypothetical protein